MRAQRRYAYSTYSVNGSATQTRLVVENPDEAYADALFGTAGVLYKSDAESSFIYQGDDLATSEEQFKQLNAKDTEDVQPIVDLTVLRRRNWRSRQTRSARLSRDELKHSGTRSRSAGSGPDTSAVNRQRCRG